MSMHERIIFEKIKPGDVPGYWRVTMERNEGAAKVGPGGTAVRDETSVWLFEAWEKFRERDQAAIAALHSLVTQINQAERAKQRRGFLLSAAAGAVCGAVAAASYFSMGR